MNAKRFSVVIVVVLLALLMTGCGGYYHGIKSCGYGGILGIGKTWVNQGQLHPENSNFVCDGTDFIPVNDETASEPEQKPLVDPAPAPVTCETIEVSKDNGVTWESAGLALETESKYDIGNRVTWTSRSSLVDKAQDVELTDAELKLVEQTWLLVRYNACQTQPVLFTGGAKINTLKFDKGALFLLPLGQHEISVRNGELVLWYDTQHQDKDLLRIEDQIRHGNFDIKSKLAFAVTDSLKDKLPADLLSGVQIVLLP